MDKKELSASLKTIKLITSSLFARKQPFMIIDCTKPSTFYYTNIDRERVALYRPTAEDVLSKVTIKDDKVKEALFKAFPILEKSIVQLDLMKFSTYLNKSLKIKNDEFPELTIHEDSRLVTMRVPTSETNPGVDANVGILLSQMDVEFYEGILTKHLKFSDKVEYRRFKAASSVGDDKVALEIVELEKRDDSDKKSEFALPIKDGFNVVSSKEYISKRGLDPYYALDVLVDPVLRAAKTVVDYSDDWLDASTIMPGTLWFFS